MKRISVADLAAAAVAGLLVAGLAAVGASLAWRSRAWPLIHDAPIMHYIAWRLAEGAAPYRDLFDMNMPGVYLVHLAVLRLGGAGDLAWRSFDLTWLAAGGLAVAAFCAPWGLVAATGGALFFAVQHLAGGEWHAGQRDFLLCPLLLIGALGVARGLEGRSSGASFGWGGLALGAALTIKPHPGLLAVAFGVLILARAGAAASRRPLALFAAGLLLPPLAIVGWVAGLGAWPAWRDIVFDYLLPLYSRLGRPAVWGFHRWQAWIPVAAALALSLAVTRKRSTPRHLVAVIGLGYGIVHYFVQGKGWEYHVYPLAAFAAVLSFSELGPLLGARRWAAGGLLAASLAAVVLLFDAKGIEARDGEWIRGKERRVQALVGDLAGRLRPGDRVQVLDTTEGGINALFRLGVQQPTRFLYDFHFFHDIDTPVIQRLRREFIGDLERRPPRFVVLFERGWPTGGYERVAAFPELQRDLAVAYRVEVRGDGYLIYAKRDDS